MKQYQHIDITYAEATGYPYRPFEYEEEDVIEAKDTIGDVLAWLHSVVEDRLEGDIHDKEIIHNLLEELEEKAKYPADTALRSIADLYEDEINEEDE